MARRKYTPQNEITPDDFVAANSPIEKLDNIDWDKLEWKPASTEEIARRQSVAKEYEQFLRDKKEESKQKQSRAALKASAAEITGDTRRHPSMYEEDSTPGKVRKGINGNGRNTKTGKKGVRLISAQRAEEWWIEQSRKNILAYMQYVWGLKPAQHHIMWFKQMLDQKFDKTIIIGPRGSAKSTIALIFITWYIGHFPHKANMLISVTLKQAQDRLETVKDMIAYNERYKRVFPNIALDKRRPNNKTTLNVKRTDIPYGTWRALVARNSDPKSPTLYASGVGGSGVIGSRCTGVMVLDDLMDERNIATEDLREKLWTWVSQTLIPTLTGGARVIHITTRWHSEDLVVKQIETGEWSYTYTRALYRGADKRVRSYWPEEFPLSRLAKIRKTIGGPIFKIMYLCIATALKGALFEIDELRQDIPEDHPAYKHVVVSVDAAVKGRQQNDDSAIGVIGVPATRDAMYVEEIYTGKWRPETVAARISSIWADAWEKYGVKPTLLIETVGGQQLYVTLLKQIGVVDMESIVTVTPNTDKWSRALPLSALSSTYKLFFRTGMRDYHKAVSQLLEFTGDEGNADDIVDMLSQLAKRLRGDIASMVGEANTKRYKIPGAL